MSVRYSSVVFAVIAISTGFCPVFGQSGPGLSVEKGVLSKGGTPYRGIGVNYFSLFYRVLKDPADRSYDAGLRQLSEAGIPFARFMCCGFWPVDWDLYQQDKEAYFQRLDAVVAAAEKYDVGLIPSLFWHYATVSDICGEPIDQLGNPDSKTSAFIRVYTEEIVRRYHDSPAIWGWEFGNEYNLAADLPNALQHRPPVWPQLKTPATRTARDELTSEQMLTAYSIFAQVVRKYDTRRILLAGNAVPRASAFHNTLDRSWTPDTAEQFKAVLCRDNPDPYDVLSVHLYPDENNRYPAQAASFGELVRIACDISASVGKPLVVGEFGVSAMLPAEQEKAVFEDILSAIASSDIPLAALWVFDHAGQLKDWNVTFENKRAYMLTQIAAVNQQRIKKTAQHGTVKVDPKP